MFAGHPATGPSSLSPCRARGPAARSCRCRKPSACRRGRRGVRWKNLRLMAPAVASLRTARGPRDRRGTTGTGMSVPSWTVDAAERLAVGGAFRNRSPTSDRTFVTSRGSGRMRDAACFGAVASASATSFRGAWRAAGRRIRARPRRARSPGSRVAETPSGLRGVTAGRRGTRAVRFSRSQRAVDVRASAITRAVATTNPTAVSVSDDTTGHPPMQPQTFRLSVVRSCETDDPANRTGQQGDRFQMS